MYKIFLIAVWCMCVWAGEFPEKQSFSSPDCSTCIWLKQNNCWYNPVPQPNEPLKAERVINQFHRSILKKEQKEKDAHLDFIMNEDFSLQLSWSFRRFLIAGAVFIGARSTNDNVDKPLHCALEKNDHELIRILLNHGADPKAYGPEAVLPLIFTLQDLSLVSLFLKNGASAKIMGNEFCPRSLIHHYILWVNASCGTYEFMHILLRYEANPNSPNFMGDTPLHEIYDEADNIKKARLLIAYGADPSIKNNNEHTVLEHVQHRQESCNAEQKENCKAFAAFLSQLKNDGITTFQGLNRDSESRVNALVPDIITLITKFYWISQNYY